MPEDYESRLIEMFPGRCKKLKILAPDPYDLVLSKLERNSPKDHRSTEWGRIYRETDAQSSFTGCCRDGHDVCNKRQISEPAYKTGNDPGKPELMR
jgi:hypothetical protein